MICGNDGETAVSECLVCANKATVSFLLCEMIRWLYEMIYLLREMTFGVSTFLRLDLSDGTK